MSTAGIRFACSGRGDGNMTFHCGDTAGTSGNRERFLASSGMEPSGLVLPVQVHGGRIEAVGAGDGGRGAASHASGIPATDCLATSAKGLPVGILTADCLPVLFYDPVKSCCAACHAGWRSTRERISFKTAAFMRSRFGSSPEDILCWFGPSIRQCCYAVGDEVLKAFPRSVRPSGGKMFLDLCGENRMQLLEAGIRERNIRDTGSCTCCDPRYFSYRREGEGCGRMLTVIMLE
jgi:YfiH family protein